MAGNSQKLNEGELALYSMQLSAGYVPVGVDKKLLINAIYLELPSRINALMWVMTTALLIYTATEYLMRKKMKDNNLSIPSPDHRVQLEKPSLMR